MVLVSRCLGTEHCSNVMSLPNLTNYSIDRAERNNTYFGGCVSRNTLPRGKKLPPLWWAVNLDSSTGPGTHWVLLYNCRPHDVLYFDSYGEPPPQEVVRAMITSGKTRWYNSTRLQSLGSEQCGWWVRFVAEELIRGRPFDAIMKSCKSWGNGKQPDLHLQRFFRSHPTFGQ